MNNDKYKLIQEINQIQHNQIESSFRARQKKHSRFNPRMMDEGYAFAKSGLTLDDADDNQRNEHNFIMGYEKYMRELNVADEFYRRGAKAFFEGVNWESIPEIDSQNEAFIKGFEDAMTMSTRKQR